MPPRAERSPILADALLANMVRKGLLTPPAAPGKGPPRRPKPIMKPEELLDMLDEARSEGTPLFDLPA